MIPGAGFGQEAVRLGIYRYARPSRPWDFLHLDFGPASYELAREWKPHGAIGRAGRADLAAAARTLKTPFVNLYGGKPFRGLPQVGVDNDAIGRAGAEYLADLGFKNFGYFGLRGDPASDDRGRAFSAALAARGFSVALDTGWPPRGWDEATRATVAGWLARCDHVLLNEIECLSLAAAQAIADSRPKGYFVSPVMHDDRLADLWLRGAAVPLTPG